MKYHKYKRIIELDPVYEDNYISIDSEDFYLENLDKNFPKAKGGNSCVFKLVSAGDEEQDISYIIKFSRIDNNLSLERFQREITALKICKEKNFNDFIVKIEKDGTHLIDNKKFPYYIMEEAEYDLTKYLEDNEYSLPEKLDMCNQILVSVQKLHELGIYHRDIKPDNILMIDGKWKMGDLGLIKFRDEDIKIDSLKDRIGPFGYYSPEAVNYGLNLRKDEDNGFFCHIDDKSDIYQLGLVFWYIFNQQIPTGQVIADDLCLCHGPNFFDKITMPMLQYCKKRRASMTDLREQFDVMLKECGVI